MSHDQKFQQRWEFRRRDEDNDSSSNDSNSSSSGEPVEKKHKLVSNLILLDNDETSDTPTSQRNGQPDSSMGINLEFGKANGTHMGLKNKSKAIKNRRKRGSMKRNKKKSKHSNQEPVSLDAFKIFMESILQDLKVARESMFARMREEMKKLVAVESASRTIRKEGSCVRKTERAQHHNSTGLGMKTQNCKGGSLERSVFSNWMADSNNCYKVIQEPVNHDQAIETVTSNEKDKGERLRLSVKKSKYSSNHSDQIIPSSYSTLPSVLRERQVEHHRSDSSSRNCIHPGVAGNDTNVNFGRENLMIDASTRHSYFLGVQAEEPFGSFAQMGSKNMGCYDQHSTQVSSMGTGFPVHHQRLDNSSIIPSQLVLENTFRDSNTLGRRMNGGAIRFSGGSHVLSDHYVANNFRNHMNYKADDGLMTYGTQDLEDGHLYPH